MQDVKCKILKAKSQKPKAKSQKPKAKSQKCRGGALLHPNDEWAQ